MANSEADILVTLRGGRLTAAQISADGVYVVGTDIPGGTWHTSGGQQCYEATLAKHAHEQHHRQQSSRGRTR